MLFIIGGTSKDLYDIFVEVGYTFIKMKFQRVIEVDVFSKAGLYMLDRLSFIEGFAAWTCYLVYNLTSEHFVDWLF